MTFIKSGLSLFSLIINFFCLFGGFSHFFLDIDVFNLWKIRISVNWSLCKTILINCWYDDMVNGVDGFDCFGNWYIFMYLRSACLCYNENEGVTIYGLLSCSTLFCVCIVWMAGTASEESGGGRSYECISSMQQRCASSEALAEWRSSEQLGNGSTSTSPLYWDSDDDDFGMLFLSPVYPLCLCLYLLPISIIPTAKRLMKERLF